ncbi:restriction endonuclease [Mycobacterium sp. 852002-51961_SCH5331710]|nr:restriction endonuclease [Mycobacterium sp. 852002-51961_SCH5331710]
MRITQVYRYPQEPAEEEPFIDGFPNYYYATVDPKGTQLQLESGINRARMVRAEGGTRRPVIALRSSPAKAGGEITPWHDVFELDHGYVRYFGDHKRSTPGVVGSSVGNKALFDAALLHQAKTADERMLAPPIAVFRGVTEGGVAKGYVEFCGVAVIERVEIIVQRDPKSNMSFANYVFDLAVLKADAESEFVDWRWIDDRRNPDVPLGETPRHAPKAWRNWVEYGNTALPRLRRQVLSSRLLSRTDQQPTVGSADEKVLKQIYTFYDQSKHAFELLASKVAADVLGRGGTRYREGWITRGGGDGGADFVGRLDVGVGHAMTSLVVLGQAKCVLLSTSISAEQLARIVARLRRGWVGVYVTTGVFSRSAQIEMYDDQYPIVLIDGRTLADSVRRMAMDSHGGDLATLLTTTASDYESSISFRRPEEILSI